MATTTTYPLLDAADRRQLRTAVDRGARALDAVRPGWWRAVRARDLDITNATRCVIGQVAGGSLLRDYDDNLLVLMLQAARIYPRSLSAEEGRARMRGSGYSDTVRVGYAVPGGWYGMRAEQGYQLLQARWLHHVAARRRAYRQRLAARRG